MSSPQSKMASSRSKKASKRSLSPSPNLGSSNKKKRPATPIISEELDSPSSSPSSYTASDTASLYNTTANGQLLFKDPNFEHSGVTSSKKKVWKNLKQILSVERSQQWKEDDPTYASTDAPPSFRPAKKYSDMSGLPAKYKDPSTGILYTTSSEFATIRSLPSDIVTGYLSLRKAGPT